MKTRRAVVFVSTACVLAACGSRTGLLVPIEREGGPMCEEGGCVRVDAAEEADATEPDVADATFEPDAVEEDVFVPPDGPDICPDAGSTLIYVISSQNELLSFYPPTATFSDIGSINCPTADPSDTPFSMAVDRQGTAYVLFQSGNLFRVSTKTAACGPTPFVANVGGPFQNCGMGYAANDADAGETLYLAGDPGFQMQEQLPAILASLDTTSFQITPIGPITPSIFGPELTGTGTGELFAFWAPNSQTAPSFIDGLNKTTAQVVSSVEQPTVTQGGGWAFAFWGGDFYMFTAPLGLGTPSVVTRYATDGTMTQVASTSVTIVGAGVSTCAPQM